jgi:hypothetical protein
MDHERESAATVDHLKGMGRDAMNLVEFPLTLLAGRAPKDCKTLVFEDRIRDRGHGEDVTRRMTVSGSDRFGLPTALDDEVILGLLQLTKADNFASRRVHFNRYHLLRVLGWRNEGKSYTRLDKSLRRWTGVTLYYDNAWWDKLDRRWVNASLHLLDEVVLQGRIRVRDSIAAQKGLTRTSYFTWNEIVFKSFQAGYLKQLDWEFYRNLNLAAAKKMYRFLDKRFHFGNQLRFDLATFAYEHVGLSRRYDAAQLKRRLTPAVQELEAACFLTPLSIEERFHRLRRGRWEVLFVRAPKSRRPRAETRPLSALEQRLVDRGVAVSSAVRLVREYPACQIQEKIEVFDAISTQGNSQTMRNPAGFLVQSIREDYKSPIHCKRPTKDATVPGSQRENAATLQNRSRNSPEFYVEQRVQEYLDNLSPEGS